MKPTKTFENGNCRASIFYNEVMKDDKAIQIPNVTIAKSYQDKEGEWQRTNTYSANDLPRLISVAMKAYDYLTDRANKPET